MSSVLMRMFEQTDFYHPQVRVNCHWQWAGQSGVKPRCGGGHHKTRCCDPPADFSFEGNDELAQSSTQRQWHLIWNRWRCWTSIIICFFLKSIQMFWFILFFYFYRRGRQRRGGEWQRLRLPIMWQGYVLPHHTEHQETQSWSGAQKSRGCRGGAEGQRGAGVLGPGPGFARSSPQIKLSKQKGPGLFSMKGRTVRETLKTAFRTSDCPLLEGGRGKTHLNITVTSLLTICMFARTSAV